MATDCCRWQWTPILNTWRLNERNYGALTGLVKAECVDRHGLKQVQKWRRGYYDRPPPWDETLRRQMLDRRYGATDGLSERWQAMCQNVEEPPHSHSHSHSQEEPTHRESSEGSEGSSESSNDSDGDGDGDSDCCSILEDDKFVELPFPPDAESLRDCTARTLPFLYGELQPAMKRAVAKARAACAESGEEYEVRRLRLRLRLRSHGEWRGMRGIRGADGPLMASDGL